MNGCLERLAETRARTEVAITDAAPAELADEPFGHPWSVNDILLHLANFDTQLSRELARALSLSLSLPGPAIDFTGDIRRSEARQVSRDVRQRLVEWLAGEAPGALATRLPMSSHPLLIGRTISEALDFCAFHESRHCDEIEHSLSTTRRASIAASTT